ncbi:MAG: hypothetical protein IJW59_04970 [Clostridia bacterium]|nr:hypothetical protein [Clostridia bacterium]
MKALKGLLIYIGIILGSILGLAAILVSIMYFVPTFKIAGVGMVHYQKSINNSTISLKQYSDYDEVVLSVSSKTIPITILPTDAEEISYKMNLSVFGFASDIVEYKLGKNVEQRDNKLYIYLNTIEPSGWISISGSGVSVSVPSDMKISLVTSTTSGSVSIGGSKNSLNIDMLSVSTSTGNLNLVNLGSGETEKTLELKSLNLTTQNGTFDLSGITNIKVLEKVKLVAEDGVFGFNNLFASVNVTGKGVTLNANDISCGDDGFKCITNNVYLNIESLKTSDGCENSIISENMVLKIKTIVGKTGISTIYGKVDINSINGYAMIENENGSVSIKNAYDTIIITTEMGDISVDSYMKTGKFKSNKGNITVNSWSDYISGCYTDIECVDGNVTAFNKINKFSLKTTGYSRSKVDFGIVKEGKDENGLTIQHRIEASMQGSCIVKIPTFNETAFMFEAHGNISGEISGLKGDENGGKVYAKEGPQYYPSNKYIEESMSNASFYFDGKIEIGGHSSKYE